MKLIDLPQPIPMSVYEETREAVRRAYAQIPGVVDVIEYGTIPHPGISDMDFIIVIEPGAIIDIPPLHTYTKDQQYAMDHAHFVISTSTLPHLRLLDPFIVNFTPLLGRTHHAIDTIQSLSNEELRAFALEYPFVSWILPWFEFFARVECLQELSCRYFLEGIKLLPYCFRELHRAGLIEEPVDHHADCFRAIANEWFEISATDRPNRVQEALEKSRESTKRYLEILHQGFQKNSRTRSWVRTAPILRQSSGHASRCGCIEYDFGSEIYTFEKNRTEVDIDFRRTHSPLTPQTYTHVIHYLPLAHSAPLNRLLFEEGHLPDFIREHVSTDLPELPVLTHPILEERTELINQTMDDIKNVRGGKLLGQTYGLRRYAQPDGGSLRAKCGGIYDRTMARLSQSALSTLLKYDHLRITL